MHHAQSHISRTSKRESLTQLLKHSSSKTSNDKEIAQVQRILIPAAPSTEAAQRTSWARTQVVPLTLLLPSPPAGTITDQVFAAAKTVSLRVEA